MKEQLYTIPMNDAVNANDECPFCFIERNVEQDLMDLVLGSGSSYMESDMRDKTDAAGFCRRHWKAMFDYGNTLGNAWILKTHTQKMQNALSAQAKAFTPGKGVKKGFFGNRTEGGNAISMWIREQECSCYICSEFQKMYRRYLDTFFYLWKNDTEFRAKIEKGKGFCLPHLGDLCEAADQHLGGTELEDFYRVILPLEQQNLERIHEDVSWMVEKFDYRNKDADWKNSKDSIQRSMQKLKGGYPADPAYKQAK